MNKCPTRTFLSSGVLTANFARMRNLQMCDQCVELDKKIEHYKRLGRAVSDQLTLDRIKQLVEQMKALKATLHPEPE